MLGLYNVKLYNNKQCVYDEALPFSFIEPNEENIRGIIKLIRPNLVFDTIETKFIKEYDGH